MLKKQKQKQKQISDTLQTSKVIPVPQSVQEVSAFDTPIYHNTKPSENHVSHNMNSNLLRILPFK